ncbi:MAG TPA: OmpA family protein [Pseudobdellovibrionaceae bacterium]|jgi:outer membrane protein OmpA-like peptidoglycan-associated protein
MQSQVSQANVLGMDSQTFNPTTNGLDFVTVHSSATLDPGIVNIGFFLNYAVNSLPYVYGINGSGQARTKFNDRLFSSDLNFGVGLGDNWDMGFALPYLWSQSVDDGGQLGKYSQTGMTGQRWNSKYRFFNGDRWGWAAVASVDQSLVENNPYTGENPGPTYNLELVADVMLHNVLLGFNIGHRWRNPGASLAATYGITPLPNQWIYSVAASYLLASLDTKLIWELYGSYPDGKSNDSQTLNISDRERSSLETLVGMKYDWTTNLAVHFGGGTEIYHGTGTPAWRIYSGINYAFGPVWEKRSEVQPRRDLTKIPKVQNFTLTFLRFKFDSTELDPSSYKNLDIVVRMIRETPGVQSITIEGHTDSVGSESYNQKLSQSRANVVKTYLKEHMLELAKVDFQGIGYGESRPIANNGNYQGRAKNRRVVIRVVRKIMIGDKPETEESSITF